MPVFPKLREFLLFVRGERVALFFELFETQTNGVAGPMSDAGILRAVMLMFVFMFARTAHVGVIGFAVTVLCVRFGLARSCGSRVIFRPMLAFRLSTRARSNRDRESHTQRPDEPAPRKFNSVRVWSQYSHRKLLNCQPAPSIGRPETVTET